jgi:hypothetical protein
MRHTHFTIQTAGFVMIYCITDVHATCHVNDWQSVMTDSSLKLQFQSFQIRVASRKASQSHKTARHLPSYRGIFELCWIRSILRTERHDEGTSSPFLARLEIHFAEAAFLVPWRSPVKVQNIRKVNMWYVLWVNNILSNILIAELGASATLMPKPNTGHLESVPSDSQRQNLPYSRLHSPISVLACTIVPFLQINQMLYSQLCLKSYKWLFSKRFWICSQELWPLDHRGTHYICKVNLSP